MTYFVQAGDVFSPTSGKDTFLDGLPVGNYIIIQTMQGLKFQRVDSFGDPGKMYGNIDSRAERIMRTFLDRPRTTGVLLSGEKGSGKSQLARNVSRLGYEAGIPTILVNAPYAGDEFNALLASIEQPAIVLMDEFEKVYSDDRGAQEQVLTLLDGMMTSQKLFVLTVNDKYRVNDHMKNRPGRIFYALEFEGLEADFIREYCEDNLKDQEQIENVLKISALFRAFNFDMLKALVEEMNRYNETAFDAMEMLNAKPFSTDSTTTYEVLVTAPNGAKSEASESGDIPLGGDGRSRSAVYVNFEKPEGVSPKQWADQLDLNMDDEDLEEGNFYRHFIVNGNDLKRLDVSAGTYEFESDGYKIVYKKKVNQGYSYTALDF